MKHYKESQLVSVELTLNGVDRQAYSETRTLLSDFLRHELGVTGTHVGCEHGVCGACTVQVDGVAVRSCLLLAVQAQGCKVDTVEGMGDSAEGCLSDLQAAFQRHHALQCGYCTAGILMSCDHYLRQVPHPNERQVKEMLSGHLCRCTGYRNIVDAVLEVVATRQNGKRMEDKNV
ncbi:(2Fe-2S)-binding protein [Neopusillimonas maritima]|jgi:2-furoyl-CoA dehydrogenase 2Fe-2S iron sulfur subunit|uniref:(2Fe-2S)-binding protein n=1 Tax=Neopusillimonas maritima TaxID=2026239 RepID=A0ABX9MWJ1_9BURK|nr:(2Fe-2S)-binding protein [Neopusillimonas maritima]RII83292.1 (2Fe-2S)-binding protein [Neopusillimonas maritima]